MRIEDFVVRADQLVKQAEATLATVRTVGYGEYVDEGSFRGLRSASLSFLRSTFGETHPYYREFEKAIDSSSEDTIHAAKAILTAARDEIAGGWAQSIRGMVAAEVFADFLEMAEHLLATGYKDASAVMIGSTLEEHLRQLATRAGIPTMFESREKEVPKKADVLNSDLARAEVYNKLEQKSVTAWLDLRNKAAHGQYGEYSKEHVEMMLRGVLEFMTRYPL
jgi:hypothetical protein